MSTVREKGLEIYCVWQGTLSKPYFVELSPLMPAQTLRRFCNDFSPMFIYGGLGEMPQCNI